MGAETGGVSEPSSGERHIRYWANRLAEPKLVYVLRAGKEPPVKIGTAQDVAARIAVLQTGNPYPLKVLCALPGGQPLEVVLHRYLAGSRLTGEWFDGPRVRDALARIAWMAEEMIEAHDGGPEPPLFTDFIGWIPLRYRRQRGTWDRSSEVVVRHIEPDPIDPEESDRRQRERWLRPWEALPETTEEDAA